MTLTQLEYVVAIANYGSFGVAAEKCCVTQPTLSMQIQKLEEELGMRLFDRSRKPVVATDIGRVIIEQARRALAESERIKEIAKDSQQKIEGELHIGVIPTLAPYLLPLFLVDFVRKYPQLHIVIAENTTERIVERLKEGTLDVGLLATPLDDSQIRERPLFYEPFVAYLHGNHPLAKHTLLTAEQLDGENIWLLNEGHCLRSQILHLCQRTTPALANLRYEIGSIETLKRIVEITGGMTILPELAIKDFGPLQLDRVRYFHPPEPVREISLVTHRNMVKEKALQMFEEAIRKAVPERMRAKKERKVVKI